MIRHHRAALRLVLFMARHRRVAAVVCRLPGWSNWAAHVVWDSIDSRRVDAGLADIDAGRWYLYDYDTGRLTPNPEWPTSGRRP